MQRVQDQDNGINIKFGSTKSKKGDYKLVSQRSENEKKSDFNGTNKHSESFSFRKPTYAFETFDRGPVSVYSSRRVVNATVSHVDFSKSAALFLFPSLPKNMYYRESGSFKFS